MEQREILVTIFAADPTLCTGVYVDKTGSVDIGTIGFWQQRAGIPGIINRESPVIRGQQLTLTAKRAPADAGGLAMLAFAAHCDAQHRGVNPRAQATPEQMADYALRHKARLKRYMRRCIRHYQARPQAA